jgi:hypothetical protein
MLTLSFYPQAIDKIERRQGIQFRKLHYSALVFSILNIPSPSGGGLMMR